MPDMQGAEPGFEETENESIWDGKIPSSPEDIGGAFKG
jgi:hypothetical protein